MAQKVPRKLLLLLPASWQLVAGANQSHTSNQQKPNTTGLVA
jgi:hypothetical protein